MDDACQRLLDEAAIRDVMSSYARGIDRMDRDLIESAYWEDGYDRHALFAGSPREFTDWVLSILALEKATLHHLGQSLIRIEGDRAAVETYYSARHLRASGEGEAVFVAEGRYADVFERRGPEWRVLFRDVLVDWSHIQPIVERQDPSLMLDDRVMGKRSPEDASYDLFRQQRQ
jgi:hypothetical protein